MILALDLSLTSTGVAYRKPDGKFYIGHIASGKLRDAARLHHVAGIVAGILAIQMQGECRYLAMEGPAFGFKQQATRSHSLGELHGAVKVLAWSEKIDILTVPPTNLKMFVTGNGAAKKPHMELAVKELWGVDIPEGQDDEVDAFGLLMLAEAFEDRRRRRRYDNKRIQALNGCKLSSH